MTKLEQNEIILKQAIAYACKQGSKQGLLTAIECVKECKRKGINDINVVLLALYELYKEICERVDNND